MMSKVSMVVHQFLFDHRLKEAATSECKHQLAESTNSHRNPAPTSNLTQHQLGEDTNIQFLQAPTCR